MEEYADRMEGGILDDQGQLITDVMAMTGRIAQFELSFLELFFRKGSPEPVEIKCDGGCIDQECRIPSFPPTCATGIEDAGNDGYELSLITFAEEPVDSVGRCYILNPIKPRNFFRDLISWTTKAISTEKNMATRAILIACSADATGVIPLFESSCLVLRVDTADKTFCKSNHFWVLRFYYQGGVHCYTKLVFLFEYDQFCGLFSIDFLFRSIKICTFIRSL